MQKKLDWRLEIAEVITKMWKERDRTPTHAEIMVIISCAGQQRAQSQFIKAGREHKYQLESFSFGLKLCY